MKKNVAVISGTVCVLLLVASVLLAQQPRGPMGSGGFRGHGGPGGPGGMEAGAAFSAMRTANQDGFPMRAPRGPRGGGSGNIVSILQDAGVPLSDEQIAQLKELQGTPGNPPAIETILTDQQKQALETARQQMAQNRPPRMGRQGNRGMRGPGPRGGFGFPRANFEKILNDAGVPLTAEQLAQLRPVRGGVRPDLMSILTGAQLLALQNAGLTLPDNLAEAANSTQRSGDAAGKLAGVEEQPVVFGLRQNYPNPFNPSTTIEYSIDKPGKVVLEVFNLGGQKIDTLVNATQEQGSHSVSWDATSLANGVYLYRITTGGHQVTMKMLYVK